MMCTTSESYKTSFNSQSHNQLPHEVIVGTKDKATMGLYWPRVFTGPGQRKREKEMPPTVHKSFSVQLRLRVARFKVFFLLLPPRFLEIYKQHQTKHLLYVLTGCDMKFASAPNHQIPQLFPCVCCTWLPSTVMNNTVELHPYDSPSQ